MHERFTAYLAPQGFVPQTAEELRRKGLKPDIHERLLIAPGPPVDSAWAQNVWLNPQIIPISSVKDGVNKLKEIQRNWALYSVRLHRRAALIEQQLPKVSARPLAFGDAPPTSPLGSWTLWDERTIIASPDCSSPFTHGEPRFVENTIDPPNRAYLKLWELFTLTGLRPQPEELCLDLGASPGGWSWVLAQCGARVFAVDKAPLAANVGAMPNVEFCNGSGFGLDPRHAGRIDILLSDMACYPSRLYELVKRWLELGDCRRFVCTLKFQHETDHATAEAFAAIPDSRLLHLSCNKHELTWIKE